MTDCIAPIYLPASYNGVYFECLTAGSAHGRRGVTGEFPFGEQTAYQDLGIKIRKYSISGRFQGPDCVTQMTTLILAVETPGPGTLIHPTRGNLMVACTDLKVKDDINQGAGETTFDMEFVDASSFSTSLSSLPIIPAIASLLTSIDDDILSTYTPDDVLFFQSSTVASTVTNVLTAIATAFDDVIDPNVATTAIWQTLHQVQSFSTDDDIWLSPTFVVQALTYGCAAIDTYASSADDEYVTFKGLANQFALTPSIPDVGGQCQETMYSAVRCLCAGYMLRSATQIVSTTLSDVLTRMDAITAIIENEKANCLANNDNSMFIALANFEAGALQSLIKSAYNLPPIISYNFNGAVPSLVAAHEIYGDCTQFQALEERNPNNWPFALGPVIYALGTIS